VGRERSQKAETILLRLRRPEICAPETYQELVRTLRMQERVLAMGLVKNPVSERERLDIGRTSS